MALCDRLSDLETRSISHGNLSNNLASLEQVEESARHLLAAIVYNVVTGHWQHLSADLNNLQIRMRRAAEADGRYQLPRLVELLGRPEFGALQEVLVGRGVGVEELQASVDELVERVSEQVAGASSE